MDPADLTAALQRFHEARYRTCPVWRAAVDAVVAEREAAP